MRIGITGSVGFLGANLARYIHENHPDGLLCFYSNRRNNPLTEALELSYQHLDIMVREEVLQKTRDLDILFHLAGVVDYSRKNAKRTWDVNVLGSRNIFEAAIVNRIPKLVYASSINVLGTVAGAVALADETNRVYRSRRNPISFSDRSQALAAVEASVYGDYGFLRRSRVPYFDSKLAAYEMALDYHRRSALPVLIVLPGTAVGPGDIGVSITELVYRTYQGKLRLTLPGSTSFVASRDAAEGIWLTSVKGKAGQSYIITGREEDNLSYKEFMKRVAKVARNRYDRDVPDRFFRVPAALCYPLAQVLRYLSVDGTLSEALILSGTANHRFSHQKAGKELGYRPKVSLEEAIRACIDFYTQNIGGVS